MLSRSLCLNQCKQGHTARFAWNQDIDIPQTGRRGPSRSVLNSAIAYACLCPYVPMPSCPSVFVSLCLCVCVSASSGKVSDGGQWHSLDGARPPNDTRLKVALEHDTLLLVFPHIYSTVHGPRELTAEHNRERRM